VTFVAIKVRSAIQVQRESQGFTLDFFTAIKSICYEILPKILVVPFMKWLFFYYVFYKLERKEIKENEFTYQKIVDTSIIWSVMIIKLNQ
jgi:hypothetical protein